MINLGQIAYEAYCKSTGGKSAVTGEPLPAWDEQDYKIQDAWMAAAAAIARLRALNPLED